MLRRHGNAAGGLLLLEVLGTCFANGTVSATGWGRGLYIIPCFVKQE